MAAGVPGTAAAWLPRPPVLALTGGSGFIGRALLPRLRDAGWQVHALGRRPVPAPATSHAVDLRDADAVARALHRIAPDAALHLAWALPPQQRFWSDPGNADWVALSAQFAAAARQAGAQRLLAVGSAAEYGWDDPAPPAAPLRARHERDPLRPASAYGQAKCATHRAMAAAWRAAGGSAGARPSEGFAWVRLFQVWGEGEPPDKLVSALRRTLSGGGPSLDLGPGDAQRDLIHVADVATGLVALLHSRLRGPVNLSSGQPLRVAEVLERLAHALHASPADRARCRLGARPLAAHEPWAMAADLRRLRRHCPDWQAQRWP